MSTVTVSYDRIERRFSLHCECEWQGTTTDLYRAAAPLIEHMRCCDGEPLRRKAVYDADGFTGQSRSGLSDQDVRDIRSLAANGEAQKVIAVRFGVSQGAISLIVQRKTRRDVK
jgi:hypothetical protein